MMLPWRWYPKIELVKFKRLDFFPAHPDFKKLDKICIGSKTRTIGDALMLSHLPRLLKNKFRNLRVSTYIRGFNPVVFYNNPFVDSIDYCPGKLYGDDCNWGEGHLIELKNGFFGFEKKAATKPEVYLTHQEKDYGNLFKLKAKQQGFESILILHPEGHTWKNLVAKKDWVDLVSELSKKYYVVQVGVQGHELIHGVHDHFLAQRTWDARKLFALMSVASRFVGVNSGPMHVARAFLVPSLILTKEGVSQMLFDQRNSEPYFIHSNWKTAFLYSENMHQEVNTALNWKDPILNWAE